MVDKKLIDKYHTVWYGVYIMKMIDKNDWFREGFAVLETEGFGKITIDTLCRRLKITKGSFYHHFRNAEGFIEAFMDYWLEENTLALIRQTENIAGEHKMEALTKLTLNLGLKTEMNIRAWSYSNATVKEYVERTDKIRLEYLINVYMELGHAPQAAGDLARLEYATLIGIQQLYPDLSEEELKRMQKIYSLKR